MVRRSTPASKTDDAKFPVRVRLRTPDNGYGRQLNEMHEWLDDHAGRDGYAVHGFNLPGIPEGGLWYFRKVETAHTFVERFGCEVLVIERD